ncbi:MAG: Ig-like domain-containing protein [Lachnospiraceae bacterium]
MHKIQKYLACALTGALVLGSFPVTGLEASAVAPKLNTTSKNLKLGKTYTFKVSNAKAGSTYTWKSSKKKVVSVTSAGKVKGLKVGKATITCTVTYPNKKTVKTLTATVSVKESATSLKLTKVKAGQTITVGENAHTYTYKATTASGGATSDKVYWFLTENTAGATVKNGVVSTTQPGSFNIQARTATSAANKKQGVFTASSQIITVNVPFVMEAKLTATNKVTLDMNYAIPNLTADDIQIQRVSNGNILTIKNVTTENDGKRVIVTMGSQFKSNVSYTASIPEFDTSQEFSSIIGDMTSIVIPDQLLVPATTTTFRYQAMDDNGIDVSENYPFNVFQYSFSNSGVNIDGNGQIQLPVAGDSTTVVMTYTTGETSIKSNRATITAENPTITSMEAWSITSANGIIDWNQPVHSVALSETGYRIHFKFGNSIGGTVNTYTESVDYTITSSDANTLSVDSKTGVLTPHQTGTVTLTVKSGSLTETCKVSIVDSRIVSSLTASQSAVTLSNSADINEYVDIKFTLLDQNQSPVAPGTNATATAKVVDGTANIVSVETASGAVRRISSSATSIMDSYSNDSSIIVRFKPYAAGTSTIAVTYAGLTTKVVFTVSNPGTIAGYLAFLDHTTLNPNSENDCFTTLRVYSADSLGLKIEELTSSKNTYSILASDGTTVLPPTAINLDGNNDGDVINANQLELADGKYTVVVNIGSAVAKAGFEVETSVIAYSVTIKNSTYSVNATDDLFTRLLDCMEVKVGNTVVNHSLSGGMIYYTTNLLNESTEQTVYKNSKMISYAGQTVKYTISKFAFYYEGTHYSVDLNKSITFTISQ